MGTNSLHIQKSILASDQDKWRNARAKNIPLSQSTVANIRPGLRHGTLSNFHFLFTSNIVRGKKETTDLWFPIIVFIMIEWWLVIGQNCQNWEQSDVHWRQMTITQELERRQQWSCPKILFTKTYHSWLLVISDEGADPNYFIPPACPVISYCVTHTMKYTADRFMMVLWKDFTIINRVLPKMTFWQVEIPIEKDSCQMEWGKWKSQWDHRCW